MPDRSVESSHGPAIPIIPASAAMNRRSLLMGISGVLGAASAFVVGAPGIRFFLSGILGKRPSDTVVQRVARLRDLTPGKPVQVSVVGNRRDAWTMYPDEVIGRVWLVRSDDAPQSEKPPAVTALTDVCPHLGCAVQLDSQGGHFVCPCHRAAFALDGQRLSGKQLHEPNHAPRGMDSLECRLVRDEASDDWWVEVEYEKFEQGLTRKLRKA